MRRSPDDRSRAGWLTACIVSTGLAVTVRAQGAELRVFMETERWLISDQTSSAGLDASVKELLADVTAGFTWLAAEVARDTAPARQKGLEMLVQHAALEFVRGQRASGVRYVGQHDALRLLQPQVGRYLFGLLLDTPSWYPLSHRARLVPALRDLQPTSPGEPLVGRIIAVVENVSIEPEPLRQALAELLWQWGLHRFAQERIDALTQQSTEGDVEDRVRVLLELAELYYDLREYRLAASTHRSVQAMAHSARVPLKPIDHYQSACAHTLSGDKERAFEALSACATLLASPDLDSSQRLERRLFESDPEIEPLRRDERFAAILAKAFPAEPASKRRR
jgi:hypothetical protein